MSYLNNRAREIFIENVGNREIMKHNNQLKEYESFKISKEMEFYWKDEYINELFIKIDSKCIDVMDLESSICVMIKSFNDYSDYKKLLSIRSKYLMRVDLLEQIIYFEKVIETINSMLIVNDDITNKAKLEIVCELEAMITDTINKKDDVPDKLYNEITQRYGLETKVDFSSAKLIKLNNEVKEIKMRLLNLEY